jgi:hypothetical protein
MQKPLNSCENQYEAKSFCFETRKGRIKGNFPIKASWISLKIHRFCEEKHRKRPFEEKFSDSPFQRKGKL